MFHSNAEANQMVVTTGQFLTDPLFADEVRVSHEDVVKDVVFLRRLSDIQGLRCNGDNLGHKCVFQHLEQSVALLVSIHGAPWILGQLKSLIITNCLY